MHYSRKGCVFKYKYTYLHNYCKRVILSFDLIIFSFFLLFFINLIRKSMFSPIFFAHIFNPFKQKSEKNKNGTDFGAMKNLGQICPGVMVDPRL